jgi:hypothetical protein
MNAVQRLAVRLWDAVFGEPPPLRSVSRDELDEMGIDEVVNRQRELKDYLDQVEMRVRRDLAIEARNMKRGRK